MSARVTIAAIAATLLFGAAAGAQAQLDIDTELTPKPAPAGTEAHKEASQWTVMAGAKFDQDGGLFKFSPTPYTVDFFSTAFAPTGEDGLISGTGFFAGAQCKENEGETISFDELEDCEREPAIYRLAKDERGDQKVERVLNPNDEKTRRSGYVAAVAWIDSDTALAVGGDGTYPRREPATPVDDPDYVDPAGDARAWLYEDGSWRELQDLPDGEDGDEMPDAMEGMTALACGDPKANFSDRCLAGGLQRLWWWRSTEDKSAGFDPKPVKPDDVRDSSGQPDFRFRARAIGFSVSWLNGSHSPMVATSGCCAAPGSPTGARILSYEGESRWASGQRKPATIQDVQGFAPDRAASEGVGSAGSEVLPDSYYALTDSAVIASPGGPPSSDGDEPGSRILAISGGVVSTSPDRWKEKLADHLTDRALDSVRLLAADAHDSNLWTVGRLKESELGVAYTTNPDLDSPPDPLSCTPNTSTGFLTSEISSCEPIPENVTEWNTDSKRLVGMGTYALNALTFVGTDGKTAWAAGDRGALARLGGDGSVGAQDEPPAPFIRPKGETALSEREPFDAKRPATSASPGPVPPLSAQPLEKLPEPALVPHGSANPMPTSFESTTAFAMSRDGSEGWAIGTVPHRFDGERWLRCDPTGGEGALPEPDEACASLLEAGDGKFPDLTAIARIPLEQDPDPTNDDEFAAIAVGKTLSGGSSKGWALSLQKGRWEPDSEAVKELALGAAIVAPTIAFHAPDDGWMTMQLNGGTSKLYHYTGAEWPDGKWYDCGGASGRNFHFDSDKCGEGVSSLPLGLSSGDNLQLQLAGDTLFLAGTRTVGQSGQGATYPFVAAKELRWDGDDEPRWRMEYDPGCPQSKERREGDPEPPPTCTGSKGPNAADQQGKVSSFSVVSLEGKSPRFAGWLVGRFGAALSRLSDPPDATREVTGQGTLIRRDPDSREWSPHTVEDAAADFLHLSSGTVISARGPNGEERAVIIPSHFNNTGKHPWLTYDPERGRWKVLRTPFVSNPKFGNDALARQAAADGSDPDGQGGLWAAVRQGFGGALDMPDQPRGRSVPTYLYHYTDHAPKAVFEDATSPVRELISDLDGTADGTVWVGTRSDRLYRYDRITGWERVAIPGWDRGRTVTRASSAFAVAVNDSGVGVAVGQQGRIADISPEEVRLDPTSGRRCSDTAGQPPCGTPRDLRAAAVAPDGSALVGGDNLTLMWRPAGGDFRLVSGPPTSAHATVTAISMPAPGQAWLTTQSGEIWAGTLVGGNWRWGDGPESGAAAAADETGWSRLNDIALDASGRGLVVGARGAMLERSADGTWRRLDEGYLDDLYSVALPPQGYGDGVLVGGSVGVVLTRIGGEFHLARRSDIFDPVTNGHGATMAARIVGVAVAGGDHDGDIEAWAASQIPVEAWSRRDPPPGALLHYANGNDPLLDPGSRARALPDAPISDPAELTLAAFGRTECRIDGHPRFCPEHQGSNMAHEVVTRRIQEELRDRAGEVDGGLTALFTGDINTAPGREEQWGRSLSVVGRPNTPLDVNATHNTWRDLVAEPLAGQGVPLFSALGKADLQGASECVNAVTCPGTRDLDGGGLSLQWRESFAGMASPWGGGDSPETEALEFEPVERSLAAVEADEGANTHYAADITRDGEEIARLVVLDNSMGSLAESTHNQGPVEEQQTWLEEVLCKKGSATDTGSCTREADQEAVVLANHPTYTYANNISPTETATDGAALEATLLRHDVSALITGRLGWNGLYYACAPGLHYPHPGDGYPERAPKGLAECAAASGGQDAPSQLADAAATATGAVSGTPTGALPVVVASGAGGRFGPRGDTDGTASEGFWRGYAVVRIDPENGKVTVEQRPVLDWIGLTASRKVLNPRQRLLLHGFGREPAGIDAPLRYLDIDSPAITHRYDLLAADPEKPWLPLTDAKAGAEADGADNCEGYVCLPEKVASVDSQSGQVKAGAGKHSGTYALAMLSVGERSATTPLYFSSSPSFRAAPIAPSPPVPLTAPISAPGNPPTPPNPQIPSVSFPTAPVPPSIVPPPPAPPASPPQPPVPPVPTVDSGPSPLSLSFAPTGLIVAPQASVIPPPAPPINPAPPGGARKEARQRQAATQKSGADSAQEGEDGVGEDAGDRVNTVETSHQAATRRERPGPSELAATRRERTKPTPSFSPVSRDEQASAWVQGALYGGGIAASALILALGFGTLRPTPRRREPRLPAPAVATTKRRRR